MYKLEYTDHVKSRGNKDKKRDQVPNKFKRSGAVDLTVKKSLAVWRNSSSGSEEFKYPEDASMLAIKDEEDVFNLVFTFYRKIR